MHPKASQWVPSACVMGNWRKTSRKPQNLGKPSNEKRNIAKNAGEIRETISKGTGANFVFGISRLPREEGSNMTVIKPHPLLQC